MSSNGGQYMTTDETLQHTVYSFMMNDPDVVLEPSFGMGHLVRYVYSEREKIGKPIKFDLYEIDEKLKSNAVIDIDNCDSFRVKYCDFLKRKIKKTYKTIIGNPPYVRTKKGNLYIDFIGKCIDLLDDNGELIFIIPSDFFKLTSAKSVIGKMFDVGSISHIYHPNNERLFEGASIDVMVFRYCKIPSMALNVHMNVPNVLYNGIEMKIINSGNIITFDENLESHIANTTLDELCNVYVGMVSGKEEVFKNDKYGNIFVLNGSEKRDKYIFTKEFPTGNKKLDKYLNGNKEILLSRKIRKLNDSNWFEWGAPRNIKIMENLTGEDCIYVHNITRKENIAFKGKVEYFGGGLLCVVPKHNVELDLDKIVEYLNSETFKHNFIYSGRFKIGHRQLSKTVIDRTNVCKK